MKLRPAAFAVSHQCCHLQAIERCGRSTVKSRTISLQPILSASHHHDILTIRPSTTKSQVGHIIHLLSPLPRITIDLGYLWIFMDMDIYGYGYLWIWIFMDRQPYFPQMLQRLSDHSMIFYDWLVVSTSLKNMKVHWDDNSQYMET